MANTWGQSGTTWGQNQWGDQADVDVSITAPTQLSTTLGTVTPFNEIGWGSDTWGAENWGESGFTVLLSGLSATSSVGTITPSDVIGLTGLSATSSVGTLSIGLGIPLTVWLFKFYHRLYIYFIRSSCNNYSWINYCWSGNSINRTCINDCDRFSSC
jgi:hypothetical protein